MERQTIMRSPVGPLGWELRLARGPIPGFDGVEWAISESSRGPINALAARTSFQRINGGIVRQLIDVPQLSARSYQNRVFQHFL